MPLHEPLQMRFFSYKAVLAYNSKSINYGSVRHQVTHIQMEEEIKEVEEDTSSASEEETSEETEGSQDSQEGSNEPEDENIDYEAELEAQQTKRGTQPKPQYTQLEKAIHRRQILDEEIAKLQGEEGSKEEEEPSALDENKTRQIALDVATGLEVKRQIRTIAKSDAEAKLIQFHYENSIVRTGDVDEDLGNAWALANRRRVQNTISEMQRTILSKGTRTKGAGAGQKRPSQQPIKLSAEDQKIAKVYNLTPEEIQKGYQRNAKKT